MGAGRVFQVWIFASDNKPAVVCYYLSTEERLIGNTTLRGETKNKVLRRELYPSCYIGVGKL